MVFRIGQNTLTNKFGSKRTAQIEFLVQKSIVSIENIWSLKCFGSKKCGPNLLGAKNFGPKESWSIYFPPLEKIWLKKYYLNEKENC